MSNKDVDVDNNSNAVNVTVGGHDAAYVLCVFIWVIGVVVAQGIASTIAAVILPPYAWYLAIEHFMTIFNLLGR